MDQIISTQNKEQIQSNWADYLLILLIVALTGFQFCFNSKSGIFFLVGPLAAVMFYKRHKKFSKQQLFFLCSLIIWECAQITSGQSAPSAMINFYIRFLVYILAACSVNNFERVFFNIIYFFAIISIPFWIISNYIPGGTNILRLFPEFSFDGLGMDPSKTSNPGFSIGFYFVSVGVRNSGPFWEPGMFVVFLNIAYVIYLIKTRKPFSFKSLVILSAIITTFSTTGYVILFLILGWYFTIIELKPRSLFLLIILFLGLIVFINSDFGAAKIANDSASSNTYSRFGAIYYHLSLLSDCIITGRGFASEENSVVLTSPNGLSLAFLFWGVPFGIYYFYLLFKSSVKISFDISNEKCLSQSLIIFLVITGVAFSQDITTRHFYYFLIMYGIALSPKRSLIR